jgi:anti-sigma-K factor RskA
MPSPDPEPLSARSHVARSDRRDRQAVRSPQPLPTATKRVSKKGQFHRPELTTPWQRFHRNLAVRIIFWTLLVVVTAGVVVLALSRFAS